MTYTTRIKPHEVEEERQVIGAFGTEKETKTHTIENPESYVLKTANGEIPLTAFFDIGVKEITFEVEKEAQLLEKKKTKHKQKPLSDPNTTESNVPKAPRIHPSSIQSAEQRKYYESLISDEETQPQVIREIIYENNPLTKGRLKELAKQRGYQQKSSGLGASLRVLDNVTGEIEREGRGDSEEIRWIGQD